MTRVSARYIRKLAAQYDIEIVGTLRSNATKAKYVEMIGEAIIAREARLHDKEMVEKFVATVSDSLNQKYYRAIDLDSFFRKVSIYYLPEKKVIGHVSLSLMGNGANYRYSTDSQLVQRPAASVEEAVEKIVDAHLASLKASIA